MSNRNSVPQDCNCKPTTPYSIEKPASDRPLEAYAVGRIYQLEAQVADQESYIEQLKDAADRYAEDYRKLLEILEPKVKLAADGGTRKIYINGMSIEYCKFSRDKYYRLVYLFGLQKEDYQARVQEYKNEILYGIETDLSEDEREEVKTDYEAKVMSEGADDNAD